MKSERVSSKEILAGTDITSIKTLTRWHQRGLIPEPEIGTHPAGRGKLAYWPEWVLGRCLMIRRLIKAGKSLDEIQDQLGCDWVAEEEKWRKRRRGDYDLASVSEYLLFVECYRQFTETVENKILEILSDGSYEKVSRQLTPKMAEKAIAQAREGFNPVCVFDGKYLDVVPDFAVTQCLARSEGKPESLVVIPLFEVVVTSFSPCDFGLPSEPLVSPVARVCSTEERRPKELSFIATGKWDFELIDTPKHRRK